MHLEGVSESLHSGNLSLAVEFQKDCCFIFEWFAYSFIIRRGTPESCPGEQKDDDSPVLVVALVLRTAAAH